VNRRRSACVWRFACLALVALCLGAAPAAALSSQSLLRVTLRNDTGVTIRYLFAAASDTQLWGPDLLGSRDFGYGKIESYFLHFPGREACFDFLALDARGGAYLIEGMRFSEEGDAIIRLGREKHIGPHPGLKICRIFLTNASNRRFSYLFFAPEESKAWGFDILNDSTNLGPGDTLSFAVPVGAKPQRYEILAMSQDQALIQRQIVLQESKPDIFIDFTISDLH
jgi:hypothetical protein